MRAHVCFPQSAVASSQAAFHTGICLTLMLCMPAARAKSIPRPHHQPRQVVRIIETLEQQWQQAELHSNTAVMAAMLSDDYLGIYGDGTLATRAEVLADAKSGATHFSRIETSDRKIRIFGTTAVVVSKADVAGVNDGEDISGHYRYTRVYHRTEGVWKIVSFEASTIQKHSHPHSPPH